MKSHADQLDGFLLRVFVAVVEERSIHQAAARLNIPQPTVSAALVRLRKMIGDPLLVRGRKEMVPTEHALAMFERAQHILEDLGRLCVQAAPTSPGSTHRAFYVGTLDYINSAFLPTIVASVLSAMPNATLHVQSLWHDQNYDQALETGMLDLVIGNWASPPEHLRQRDLFCDDVVCVLRKGHPLLSKPMTVDSYLAARHLGIIPYHANRLGVIDAHLAKLGLRRDIQAVLPYFTGVPHLIAQTDLVFTTCRSFAEDCAMLLPLEVVGPPIDFPLMQFYLLWHERSQRSEECRLLRAQVVEAVKQFRQATGRSALPPDPH